MFLEYNLSLRNEGGEHTVWKSWNFSISLKKFVKNSLQCNLVSKVLISRNFCENMVCESIFEICTVEHSVEFQGFSCHKKFTSTQFFKFRVKSV